MQAMEDGGHVPFTHYVPPSPTVESGEETEQAPSLAASTDPPSLKPPDPKSGKRKRISALFGLKHKTSESSVAEAPTIEPIQSEEKQKRETDMREKERQRRQDEIEEGEFCPCRADADRYFRALQQVSAHPHSVRLADQAKVQLWTRYEHVFDGLENPPRLNPVAILRWKHKVEEQDAARKAWESRKHHLGASVESFTSSISKKSHDPFARWAYSMDDIRRYKEVEGHVEYFIPPAESALPSVDELTALEHPASSKGSVQEEVLPQIRAVSNPSSTDLLRRSDSRGSFEPLSRSPSIDHRKHKVS
jgi:hypothetical protein